MVLLLILSLAQVTNEQHDQICRQTQVYASYVGIKNHSAHIKISYFHTALPKIECYATNYNERKNSKKEDRNPKTILPNGCPHIKNPFWVRKLNCHS